MYKGLNPVLEVARSLGKHLWNISKRLLVCESVLFFNTSTIHRRRRISFNNIS